MDASTATLVQASFVAGVLVGFVVAAVTWWQALGRRDP